MWTVGELVNILKKHDQESLVAIQFGYVSGLVKSVSTLKINQDKRYHNKLVIKRKWKGDTPVTFLTISDTGVIVNDGQLYS